jgi:hypothetical protein
MGKLKIEAELHVALYLQTLRISILSSKIPKGYFCLYVGTGGTSRRSLVFCLWHMCHEYIYTLDMIIEKEYLRFYFVQCNQK